MVCFQLNCFLQAVEEEEYNLFVGEKNDPHSHSQDSGPKITPVMIIYFGVMILTDSLVIVSFD